MFELEDASVSGGGFHDVLLNKCPVSSLQKSRLSRSVNIYDNILQSIFSANFSIKYKTETRAACVYVSLGWFDVCIWKTKRKKNKK